MVYEFLQLRTVLFDPIRSIRIEIVCVFYAQVNHHLTYYFTRLIESASATSWFRPCKAQSPSNVAAALVALSIFAQAVSNIELRVKVAPGNVWIITFVLGFALRSAAMHLCKSCLKPLFFTLLLTCFCWFCKFAQISLSFFPLSIFVLSIFSISIFPGRLRVCQRPVGDGPTGFVTTLDFLPSLALVVRFVLGIGGLPGFFGAALCLAFAFDFGFGTGVVVV